ncbi:MAG: caspase family protein [Caulobacterales bacterium]|nr:caspase family protein [Caulobacterales bacterium]
MKRLATGLTALLLGAAGAALSAVPAQAEIRALIVAVSHYAAPIPSLDGTANDAAALTKVLRDEGAKDVIELKDADATRASIRGALEALGKRAKPGDWVIFYYAGHGAQAPSTDPAEADGLDEFIVLSGFSVSHPDPQQFIVDNDLHGWLVNFFPKTVNVLQIADACHSGSMNRAVGPNHFKARAASKNPMAIQLPPGPKDPSAAAPPGDPPNLVYVGAAQDNQFALEGPLPLGESPPRGLLTYALEGALQERRPNGHLAADLDDDGKLSLAELAASLETRTRELSSTQQWASTVVPPRNERSVVFQPLKPPPADERPVEVKAADDTAADILSGRGPWASIPRGVPDLTWSAKDGVVTDSHGDRVAEDLRSAEALAGVISKRKAIGDLAGSANERVLQVQVGPKPKGQLYKKGETVDLAVTHRGEPAYLTAFNLASDGTVQVLYPLDGDGDGKMTAGDARVSLTRTRAAPPFGVDNVVAVATAGPPTALRGALSRMNGKREATAAAAAVRDELDQAHGRAALALGELYTGQ